MKVINILKLVLNSLESTWFIRLTIFQFRSTPCALTSRRAFHLASRTHFNLKHYCSSYNKQSGWLVELLDLVRKAFISHTIKINLLLTICGQSYKLDYLVISCVLVVTCVRLAEHQLLKSSTRWRCSLDSMVYVLKGLKGVTRVL